MPGIFATQWQTSSLGVWSTGWYRCKLSLQSIILCSKRKYYKTFDSPEYTCMYIRGKCNLYCHIINVRLWDNLIKGDALLSERFSYQNARNIFSLVLFNAWLTFNKQGQKKIWFSFESEFLSNLSFFQTIVLQVSELYNWIFRILYRKR